MTNQELNNISIISNNCISGFLYRDYLNKKYEHPFIWSEMKYENFTTLIENFNNINFKNITVNEENKYLNVDGKVITYFPHSNITEIQNKWIRRTNRLQPNKKRIYVIWDNENKINEFVQFIKTRQIYKDKEYYILLMANEYTLNNIPNNMITQLIFFNPEKQTENLYRLLRKIKSPFDDPKNDDTENT